MPSLPIPILPLSHALPPSPPAHKQAFLAKLRHALLTTGGVFYLSETSALVPDTLINDVIRETHAFFDADTAVKEAVEMKRCGSFLGWSRIDNETTAHHPDHREQLDLSTPHPLPAPTAPLYHNLRAPNQWPSPTALPTFRPVLEDYIARMAALSTTFTALIAEALGMPADTFARFFDADQQHKLKIVKYPEVALPSATDAEDESADAARLRQGVGPHKDSMLTSYLLQASPQPGLQAQDASGEWVDVPPIPGTLVVVIGRGMEALTGGVCAGAMHRVLSPGVGEGPRYSVPFFQGVSWDARIDGEGEEEGGSVDVPEGVRAEAEKGWKGRRERERKEVVKEEGAFGKKGRWGSMGEATFMNRIRSHPDVGERWYPELLAQLRAQDAADDDDEAAQSKAR
ncbi:Clavaminate synthase-like protein [Pseudovirgaria hyperparasitica]|uniref:Clavaminate synthase-like protein n=1 Tax=Pseudovirgaria hyperparasitica TaxID=470096 RepID=A0A6A6W7P9_9PEZI|nr:Clavaminate synthase-like protein [Pseudovirgaria hyperparasitica]KAF2758565.1 Clavaminate synthase-like protein [Pseudovirgaria hyperparasitica]